jgi:hypothetical protein
VTVIGLLTRGFEAGVKERVGGPGEPTVTKADADAFGGLESLFER